LFDGPFPAAAVFFGPADGQPIPFRQFQVDLPAELVLLLGQKAKDLLLFHGYFVPKELSEFFSELVLLGGKIEVHLYLAEYIRLGRRP